MTNEKSGCHHDAYGCAHTKPQKEEPEDPIALAQKEVTEWKEKYFRALAENENTRKRLQKEKIESESFAIQGIILNFLQPIDHLEHALKHAKDASPEIRHWAQGFEMIMGNFRQILEDNGITRFESKGKLFDPHFHEAVETEETDAFPEGTIVEEFSPGYMLGHRVIRPAKVKVALTKKEESEKE